MKKFFAWAAGVIGAVLVLVLLGGTWFMRASLPMLDGTLAASAGGPVAAVTIERDADGAPTLTGESFDDVAYALGFLHAQDRFFQMDLARRLPAGELSALVGARALPLDRTARPFGFRAVAQRVLADATPAQRAWIEAYTRGVNRGLTALRARPWEYGVLMIAPEPWRAEDSVLVVHSMWWELQHHDIDAERTRREIVARLESLATAASKEEADASRAANVAAFLFPRSGDWDAPNFATLAEARAANGGNPFEAPPVPAPDALDLRNASSAKVAASARAPEREFVGSNAWAVAGRHTASGAALVAGDMHLGLRVPAVWYRARLIVQPKGAGERLELNGVTLPGVPMLAAGTNGHIVWSFTNSYGNWSDVNGYACDLARDRYVASSGERTFEVRRETLRVAHGSPVELLVRRSPEGVVIDSSGAGASQTCWLARWLAVEPGATNFESLGLLQARDLDAALELAPRVGIPHQNLNVGDASGRIAWAIIGRIPKGLRGPSTPAPIEWRARDEAPAIVDPEVGRIWSANARHVDGELERVLGGEQSASGMGYDNGARQRQIRDGLLGLTHTATPADMLGIQLDDRALFLERWQRLLITTLDEDALHDAPQRAELKRLAAKWEGRAAVDSVSYRIVRAFRDRTRTAVWDMFTGALGAGVGSRPNAMFEGSLWRLVSEQPPHLLTRDYANWRALLLAQADAVAKDLSARCGALERCTWGRQNTMAIAHPLSAALGPLHRYFDMPAVELPGDRDMPRVVSPNFGASERFAVSPGREAEGYLQVPGGQSGHPLSPFYRAGFEDWASGRARPLLPGPTKHRLIVQGSSATASTPEAAR